MYFLADARDGSSSKGSVCGECCCESITIAPGETNAVRINYASWIGATRAKGLVDGATEITVTALNRFIQRLGSDLAFTLPTPGTLTETVAMSGDAAGAQYAILSQPDFGALSLQADGHFTYQVSAAEAVLDSFSVSITENGQTTARRVAVELTALADFAFVATPDRALFGVVVGQGDTPGSVYQLVGATGLSSSYNGPQAAYSAEAVAALNGAHFVGVGRTQFGHVQVQSTGQFLYVPNDGAAGLDSFKIAVAPPGGGSPALKVVTVELPSLFVDPNRTRVKNPVLTIPLFCARAAQIGETYRMTVFQSAQDCDGTTFTHRSCYDVSVSRC